MLKDTVKEHKDVLGPILAMVAVLVVLGLVMATPGGLVGFTDRLMGDMFGNNNQDFSSSNGSGSSTTGRKKYTRYPAMVIKEGVDYTATIKTSYGDIKVDLFDTTNPKTVNSFVFLAQEGFYDGISFHRVIPDFMVQVGDPTETGTGGPGYKFDDELDAEDVGLNNLFVSQADFLPGLYPQYNFSSMADWTVKEFYEKKLGYDYDTQYKTSRMGSGVVAMANSGPNTNGSQFFLVTSTISLNTARSLDGKYTTFGTIIAGQEVVDRISKASTDSNDKPTSKITIEKVVISES